LATELRQLCYKYFGTYAIHPVLADLTIASGLALQRDLIQHVRVVTWLTVLAYLSIGIALIGCNVMLFDLLVRGHHRRWPVYASVAVLGCGSLVGFFAGSDEWTEQYTEGVGTVGAASVHVRFAIELCAIGALDLVASIVLLVRRWGWEWWLVIGLQVGAFVLAQIEAQFVDPDSPGWLTFSRFPLMTLFALFAFRIAQARLKPQVQRNLTP